MKKTFKIINAQKVLENGVSLEEIKQLRSRVWNLISAAEYCKKCYFWTSPSTSDERRELEDAYCEIIESEIPGIDIDLDFHLRVSTAHVYARKEYVINGEETTLTKVKSLYKELMNIEDVIENPENFDIKIPSEFVIENELISVFNEVKNDIYANLEVDFELVNCFEQEFYSKEDAFSAVKEYVLKNKRRVTRESIKDAINTFEFVAFLNDYIKANFKKQRDLKEIKEELSSLKRGTFSFR
jgi:hypothetical protein